MLVPCPQQQISGSTAALELALLTSDMSMLADNTIFQKSSAHVDFLRVENYILTLIKGVSVDMLPCITSTNFNTVAALL
jgi:hypothetical protein